MTWLSDWKFRRSITLDSAKIDSDQTHFSVPIFLGTSVGQSSQDVSDIFDEVGSNWQKIAVTDDTSNSQIYVEVEKWDSTNEVAVLWVSRSDLTLTSDTDPVLYIYFDNNKSDNTSYVAGVGNRTEVWNSNFIAVFHLAESSGDAIDATGNGYNASVNGSPTRESDGIIGDCYNFNGSTYLQLPGDISPEYLAFCVWFNCSDVTQHSVLLNKYKDASDGWGMSVDDSNIRIYDDSGASDRYLLPTSVSSNTWHKVITSINPATNTQSLSLDGGSFSSTDSWDCHIDFSGTTYIGNRNDNSDADFPGKLDQVFILNIVPSDAWAKLDYYAQIDDLITFGAKKRFVVATDSPSNVFATSAQLNGTLYNLQDYSSLDVYFEWGVDDSYGNTTPTQTISSTPTSFSDTISGLVSLDTFHYRTVATDGSNYWYGLDVSFVAAGVIDEDSVQSEFQNGILTDVIASEENVLELLPYYFIYFNGSNTWVDMGQPSILTTSGLGDSFTLVLWAKTNISQTDFTLAGMRDEQSNDIYCIDIDHSGDNSVRLYVDNGSNQNIYFDDDWMDGEWHLFIGSYDGTTGETYLDNVFQESQNFSGNLASVSDARFTIGSRYNSSGDPTYNFDGGIKNVRMFDRGLTSSERDTLYNSPHTEIGDEIGWWKLDEGGGDVAADSSSNSNDGTIYEATWTKNYDVTEGNRVVQLDPSSLSVYADSLIEWIVNTPTNTSITIKARLSLDGGANWFSWKTCSDHSEIPNMLTNEDLSNALLEIKEILTTSDHEVSPKINSRSVYVVGKNYAEKVHLNEGELQIFGTQDISFTLSQTKDLTTRSVVLEVNNDTMGGNDSLDWSEDLFDGSGSFTASGNHDILIDPLEYSTQYTVNVTLTDGRNTWQTSATITTNTVSFTTESATRIVDSEVRLNGNISDLGGNNSITVFFNWGDTTSVVNKSPNQTMNANGDFYYDVVGLIRITTYYFEAAVTDGYNSWVASQKDFTTPYMTIRGYVYEQGTPVERTIRVYRRSTGDFISETLSDPTDGYYYVNASASEVPEGEFTYVICLDTNSGASYDAIIYDKVGITS